MKLYALRLTRTNGSRYYYGFSKDEDREKLEALACFKAERQRDKTVVGFEIVDLDHDADALDWLINKGLEHIANYGGDE